MDLVNGKTSECASGFCDKCPAPKRCKCKCLHLAENMNPMLSSVRTYNDFAKAHNLKPAFINPKKADFSVFYRAARLLKDVPGLKHIFLGLTQEGRNRELEHIRKLKSSSSSQQVQSQ